jgi:hypothetical protein
VSVTFSSLSFFLSAFFVMGGLSRLFLGLVVVLIEVDRERRAPHAAAALLHDRERREEVAHLLVADAEGDLVGVDLPRALEVRDPVAVDDDALQREGRGLHVRPAGAPEREERGEGEAEDGEEGGAPHGATNTPAACGTEAR